MITFIEHPTAGYPARTEENIKQSDITIAFAVDFTSAGERLTEKLCHRERKFYFRYKMFEHTNFVDIRNVQLIASEIMSIANIPVNINIAGNGIYTLAPKGFLQENIDFEMSLFLHNLKSWVSIASVRTGGQTGIDEAGAKAADKLGIPTTVLAPKGWMFRDKNHKDIKSEELFKSRFK